MKKFNLQFFADEAQGTETSEPETTGTETQEPEKKYTDEDVNKLIDQKFAKWKKSQEKELADAKAEGERLAKMTADEKREHELEELRTQREQLQAELTKIELGRTATTALQEKGVTVTQDVLDFVVGADAETTAENVNKFVSIIEDVRAAAEVKRATGRTPGAFKQSGEENPFTTEINKRLAKYK